MIFIWKCLFVARVCTNSALFVGTVSMNSALFVATVSTNSAVRALPYSLSEPYLPVLVKCFVVYFVLKREKQLICLFLGPMI